MHLRESLKEVDRTKPWESLQPRSSRLPWFSFVFNYAACCYAFTDLISSPLCGQLNFLFFPEALSGAKSCLTVWKGGIYQRPQPGWRCKRPLRGQHMLFWQGHTPTRRHSEYTDKSNVWGTTTPTQEVEGKESAPKFPNKDVSTEHKQSHVGNETGSLWNTLNTTNTHKNTNYKLSFSCQLNLNAIKYKFCF